MCGNANHTIPGSGMNRRSFIQMATTGALAAGVAAFPFQLARADSLSQAERDSMSPEKIIALMKEGNERFRSGVRKNRDYLREQRASAKGQYPAAVLLSCIDSRAPAEVIMDLGIGDIFNCRVAGNVENGDILGSMEFACKVAGAKLVLVMGHTACGAVKGAIDDAQLGNLTGLLSKIKPAVVATSYAGDRSASNYGFVDAVARKNVELTVANIRRDSPVLAELESKGRIQITGAMYDLGTGMVQFFG
jgi:carbonic anhydrase